MGLGGQAIGLVSVDSKIPNWPLRSSARGIIRGRHVKAYEPLFDVLRPHLCSKVFTSAPTTATTPEALR